MNVRLTIHRITVGVRSENARFLAYCRRFLGAFESLAGDTAAELEVRISPNGRARAARRSCQTQWGSEVRQSGNALSICAHPGGEIYCEVSQQPNGKGEQIACYSQISAARRVWRLLRGRREAASQLYMTMIRQGILLPVLAKLLVKRRLLTLHASVVASDGQAFLLTGLNGCGKSGLALHLVTRHGFQYLSDNFAVVDPAMTMALAFPEPIRVGTTERSRAQGLFAGQDHAFGKWQMTPGPDVLCRQASVACLARIVLGKQFAVRSVPGEAFASQLDSLHRFLGETPEYSWIQLYYQMRHDVSLGQLAEAARKRLCDEVPCYEMEIPLAAALENRFREAAQWIQRQLGKAPRG